ncbi:MAG: helix-turn-helix domain-containing protein [Steroidobacteraceae bacterium]
MTNDELRDAIEKAGGQSALARLIGVRQSAVSNWLNRNKQVPAERVLQVEAALNGAVSRHDIRPDLYPREETA